MAKVKQAQWDFARGGFVVESLGVAPDSGPVALYGGQLQAAMLTTLFRAEVLAGAVGWVKIIKMGEDLGWGTPEIGRAEKKAREVYSGAAELKSPVQLDAAIIYLGTQGICRSVAAAVSKARDDTPRISGHDMYGLGAVPLVVMITVGVMGVAAIAATAWWGTKWKEADVQLEADKARAMAASGGLANLAQMQMQTSGKIDPAIVDAFRDMAERERTDSWLAPAAAGVAGVAVAGAAGLAIWGSRGP